MTFFVGHGLFCPEVQNTGKQIAVSFAHIVRYERYFSSAEELKRQIKKDEVSIKELFEKIKKLTKK